MRNSRVLGALFASAMMFPNGVWAADGDQAPADDVVDSAPVEEIIVTARRTEERLQDVPIAIFAADAEALAKSRIDSAENLSQISPSIRFTTTNNLSSGVNILVRGVGTTGNQRAFEGAVGFFVDGVYRSRSGQALSDFLDVQSLQILKGPQGTLFGKNTSAGALLLSSNKPSLTELGGTYQVSLGHYNMRTAKAALNVPLSDTVAVRVAGSFRDRDGFISNPNTGQDYDNLRARATKVQLLFEPSSNFSARLIGDYSYLGGTCCQATVFRRTGTATGAPSAGGVAAQNLVESLMLARGITPPSRRLDDYEQVLNSRPGREVRDRGISLEMSLETGLGELRSITAYRLFRTDNPLLDLDFSGADLVKITDNFDTKFFSQELTLSGKFGGDGRSNYLLGAYFSDEKLRLDRLSYNGVDIQTYFNTVAPTRGIIAPPGLFSEIGMSGHNKSVSGFAQVNLGLTDMITLTAGGRYSHERKQGSFFTIYSDGNLRNWPIVLGSTGLEYNDSTSDNAFSGTVSLQYRPNDNAMLYASFSRGFKAGGVVLDTSAVRVAGQRAIYNPEFVNTYEAGAKLDLFDNSVRANFAVFYNDITDLQVAQFSGLLFTVLNSPKSKIIGAEFEGYWKISDALKFDLASTWLPTAEYGVDARLGILSGRRASQAPKLTLNAALSLDQPVNDNLAFIARVQGNYTSANDISTSSNDVQGRFALVNLNVGLRSLENSWTLEGFIDNLFDKRYHTLAFARPLQTGTYNGYIGAPRTYGLTLRGSF